MKIGIDISQAAYRGTGVATFITQLVENIAKLPDVSLVLFYSSFGHYSLSLPFKESDNLKIKRFPFPPVFLDLLWNKVHIVPVEQFLGELDIFISSDWTQPPVRSAKSVTILYDLIVYKYPEETDAAIIATQKRKLAWSKKECDKFLCISQSTKKDAMSVLGLPDEKLSVVYPGI